MLFDAARLGRIDVIPALIQAGADVAVMNFAGYSPLILSCYHGHADAASVLMAHGAPVDQRDRAFGNTALMGAAFKGFGDIVELLLANHADPEAANQAGETALMFAALFGRTAIVDALLARGADPYRRDAAGSSAVSIAQAQGNDVMAARLKTRARVRG
ncbi:ankyrin repeat domain-containing protein [Pseudomonas sp.]|uniref:ankyrin repeat domain-containing protein n=1 Tax=Pseudomonas sp. TaxID=306 RepID=UPI0025F3000C|nr:ankyrin repeat domain-containing protein [Pseudomonas sp.]